MVTIDRIYEIKSATEVSKLETDLGIKLPESYKNFLMEYNGGYPSPNTFIINYKKGNDSVDIFYGINEGHKFDLIEVYNEWKSRLIRGFIPIAEDPGGNLLLLNCNGSNESVYFWDHEFDSIEDVQPNMKNMTLVSSSFESFFEKLH